MLKNKKEEREAEDEEREAEDVNVDPRCSLSTLFLYR